MSNMPDAPTRPPTAAARTIPEMFALRLADSQQPGGRSHSLVWLGEDGEVATRLALAQLAARVRSLGAALQARGLVGQRAILLFPYDDGPEYCVAFWACAVGGVVPVPAYAVDPMRVQQSLERLVAVIKDSGSRAVLTTRAFEAQMAQLGGAQYMAGVDVLAVDDEEAFPRTPEAQAAWRDPQVDPEAPLMLQYTSGSTGQPKGVVLTHRSMLAQLAVLNAMMAGPEELQRSTFCWAPLSFNMALIAFVVFPLYRGVDAFLMSPVSFIKRPVRWLKAISDHRITWTAVPNSALDLCARAVSERVAATLDLSCVQKIFLGGEPVHTGSVDAFVKRFCAASQLDPLSPTPAFGMAETTLAMLCTARGEPPSSLWVVGEDFNRGVITVAPEGSPDARPVMTAGRVVPGHRLAIVDPETLRRLPERAVGEMWFAGPSVAAGYWNKKELSDEVFHARIAGEDDAAEWIRSGDLGFVSDGTVYIAGRHKDMIIVYGHNHYPADIEDTVNKSPAVRPASSAAFGVTVDREEGLVVVAETVLTDPAAAQAAIPEIVSAVSLAHGIKPRAVALIKPMTIQRTGSNKISRSACKKWFLAGIPDPVAVWGSVGQKAPCPEAAEPVVSTAEGLKQRPVAALAAEEEGNLNAAVKRGSLAGQSLAPPAVKRCSSAEEPLEPSRARDGAAAAAAAAEAQKPLAQGGGLNQNFVAGVLAVAVLAVAAYVMF
eukprot:m51a1_g7368 putative C-tail anchored protein, AMP-binding domain (716) ;mRNA; f:61668-64241